MQMMDFKRRANLESCYLSFLSILWRQARLRVPRRHSITWRTWLSLDLNPANTRCEHFCIIFSTSAASRPNLFSITEIVVMISGIAFDRPDRLSHLRAFPCDRFKIYTIIPIVRENSTLSKRSRSSQSSGSFVIVRVDFPHNRRDRLNNIWDDWEDRDDPDDPCMETRLRRTIPEGGRCGRCQGLRGRLYLCFLSSCIAASDILPESCIFNNISTSDRFSSNWIYISFSVFFFFCLFFCTYTYDHTSKCWYIILRIVFSI